MELFHRRYLCLFSFLFLITALCATILTGAAKLFALAVIFALLISSVLLFIFLKKHRFVCAVIICAVAFSFAAMLSSFLFITLPQSKALSYINDSTAAQIKIVSREYTDGKSSEYVVRIERIGEEALNIKAYLYCDFTSELDYGDKIIGNFRISQPTGHECDQKDILLVLDAINDKPIFYKHTDNKSFFSFDGAMRICQHIRELFSNYVDGIFGQASGLVKGFLVDDRSDIPTHIQTDFKRSGTTHLLAVSGVHITLLLGSLNIVLSKLRVPKLPRCAAVSVAALALLILTNFSGSAVRAVFMLYAVYLSYLFYEDHDTVTSLFVSVFFIILISPFSVYDIGLWMSFSATLGLVTVYVYIASRLPRVKSTRILVRMSQKLLLGIVRALCITLVANFFLLPIMWMIFGEISLAAIPANLVLSPIVGVFLPVCAIGVLIGAIPVVNTAAVFVIEAFEDVILSVVQFFSDIRGAVLSLRYPFVPYLIIIFLIAMSVLLVIRLKHKWFICVPPAVFVISFCLCFCMFVLKTDCELRCESIKDEQMLFYDTVSTSSVCDLTDGGYLARSLFFAAQNPYATEIENYVIVDCTKGDAYSIEQILSYVYVRKLYLPLSEDPEKLSFTTDIYEIAKKYDTQVVFYKGERGIQLFERLIMN